MTGQEKFDTCHHRSHGKIQVGTKGCCWDGRRMTWVCWETNRKDLTPEICKGCNKYLKRVDLEGQ